MNRRAAFSIAAETARVQKEAFPQLAQVSAIFDQCSFAKKTDGYLSAFSCHQGRIVLHRAIGKTAFDDLFAQFVEIRLQVLLQLLMEEVR